MSDSPMTRGPSARASAEESPVLSSASESGSTPSRFVTRSDLQRVKRRLVNMSEHLRDSFKTTKTHLWEAIDEETQERKQEFPLFKKLLDDRTDTVAGAVRTSIDGLRDEVLSLIEPIVQLTQLIIYVNPQRLKSLGRWINTLTKLLVRHYVPYNFC